MGPRCRALRGRGGPPVPEAAEAVVVTPSPWAVQFHPRPQFGGVVTYGTGPWGSHRAHDLTLRPSWPRCSSQFAGHRPHALWTQCEAAPSI